MLEFNERSTADEIYNIGDCCYFGIGDKQNTKKAMQCYYQAANMRNVKAMKKLGHAFFAGDTVNSNLGMALMWYEKAVVTDKNCADEVDEEIYNISNSVNLQGLTYQRDGKAYEAVKCYKRAVILGNLSALNNLIICCSKGIGMKSSSNTSQKLSLKMKLLKEYAENAKRENKKLWRTRSVNNIMAAHMRLESQAGLLGDYRKDIYVYGVEQSLKVFDEIVKII